MLEEEASVSILKTALWESRCFRCHRQGKLGGCARCKIVKYCGRGCQKADWADHKHECAPLKAHPATEVRDVDTVQARLARR